VEQLQAGADYDELCPAISICLLREVLFRDTPVAHHRFQLADVEHGRRLEETLEVHTVELTKYNVHEERLAEASEIEKWVFFLLYADSYEAARLRELLPGEPLERAIAAVEAIAERTEDRMMYEQREKAERDYQWAIKSALRQGIEIGREEGREEGRQEGREEGIEAGREEGVLIGKIQLLQQLLGETPTATDLLSQRSREELNSLLAQLQERLRTRGQ